MSDLYCPSCGARHTYAGKRPKFCSSCGDSVDDLAAFGGNTGGEEDSPHFSDIASLSMDIAVEVDAGAEIARTGDGASLVSKGTKRFTKRDFVAQPSRRLADMRRETGDGASTGGKESTS